MLQLPIYKGFSTWYMLLQHIPYMYYTSNSTYFPVFSAILGQSVRRYRTLCPHTLDTLFGAFGLHYCNSNMYGRSMVHVEPTYTMPQTPMCKEIEGCHGTRLHVPA